MKWLFAGLCVLLCLSADPVQVLIEPTVLMSAPNHDQKAER